MKQLMREVDVVKSLSHPQHRQVRGHDQGQRVLKYRPRVSSLPPPLSFRLLTAVFLLLLLTFIQLRCYCCCRFAENGSLGQTLKLFGKLNERLVASYVVKILEGLDYLHRNDVVHCDLKAANILSTKTGNVKPLRLRRLAQPAQSGP